MEKLKPCPFCGHPKSRMLFKMEHCEDEYIVAYHPCHWDYVDYDKVFVGTDSFSGKSSWAKRKYQRVTHWMPKPEAPNARVKGDGQ